MKKLLSCLLAAILVITLSLSAVTLISADTDPTFVVSSIALAPGETGDVTISLKNNPGIASIKLSVEFDEALTLNSVTYNADLGGQSMQPATMASSPVVLNWFNGAANTEGDMVFATLNFTVAADATAGDKLITVTYPEDDVYDISEENVYFAVENGKITVEGGDDPQDPQDPQDPVVGTDPTFVVSSATLKQGNSGDITISLQNNPGIASIKLSVEFGEGLTLNSVTYNADLGGQSMQPATKASPVVLNWFNGAANTEGDMVFATLNFTVASNAAVGDKSITVTYPEDDVYNIDEDNIAFEVVNGKITVEASGEATCAHTNTTPVSAVASTCITPGHGAYVVCDDCGEIIEGSDAALPLDPDNHVGDTELRDYVAPTCTEKGYSGDLYCLACNGVKEEGHEIDKVAHNYVPEVTDPTCGAQGYTTYTCSVCGDSYKGDYTDATGLHTGGTATCHSKAICEVCGQEYGEFNADNHAGGTEVRNAVAATCTAEGYTGDTYCLGCGAKLETGTATEKTSHAYVAVVTDPTCTEQGYTTYTCSACGDSYKDDYTDALGHKGGTATCHSKAICEVCGEEYGEFNADNHAGGTEYKYDSNSHWEVCAGCGELVAESAAHTFEWKVVEEPTTEKTGLKKQVCSVCGYESEESEEIPKLISYDVKEVDGKKEADKVVYDSTDSKAIAVTAKFSKKDLKTVKVNGVEVSSDNYDLTEDSEGNVKVTLKEDYLKTLANGDYTIQLYTDDGVAQTNVTVKNSAATAETPAAGGDESGKTDDTKKDADTTGSDNNKTTGETNKAGTSPAGGDSEVVLMLIALLAVMGVSVFAGVRYRKKEDK